VKEQLPPKKKKGTAKRIAIFTVSAAVAAAGTIAWMSRDADKSDWKGQRSGYEETK